eukprot:4612029-Prymnesium_polylepis.1
MTAAKAGKADKDKSRRSVNAGKRRNKKDDEEENQLAAISNAVQNAANIQVCISELRSAARGRREPRVMHRLAGDHSTAARQEVQRRNR